MIRRAVKRFIKRNFKKVLAHSEFLNTFFDAEKVFEYQYQRAPADNWQTFIILADDQEEADKKAQEYFDKMKKKHQTCMAEFYSIQRQAKKHRAFRWDSSDDARMDD